MNEVKLVLKLAKKVKTPQQALVLLGVAVAFIALIYFIPPDLIE
jgi:hypothetical protein